MARVSLDADQLSDNAGDHDGDLPNDEIVVVMVDDGGDAAVGIDLQVFRTLVFLLAEIEVHGFVRQPEFFKNDGGFPEDQVELRLP